MREFEVSLTKALMKGLRPFPEVPDTPLFCEEMHNLMPSELAPRPHEPLLEVSSALGWPWPRIIISDYRIFFIQDVAGTLVLFEASFDGSVWNFQVEGSLGATTSIQQVDIADFGSFYVVSTLGLIGGVYVMQTFNRLTSNPPGLVTSPRPIFGVCCNFRQQLIGAVTQTRHGNNQVVWSGIGNYEFDPSVDRTAGFKSEIFPHPNNQPEPVIFKVLSLHEGIVLYSNFGKTIMLNDVVGENFTFGRIPLAGLGIASGNHVSGDEYIHGYIDLNYDFWTLENSLFRVLERSGGQQIKRGYRSQIKDLFDEDPRVIVSYLPRDHRFYIGNSHRTLIINKFGACTVHQAVSSVFQYNNQTLFGTFLDNGDREARITIEPTDFNARGLKTVESVIGGIIHNLPINQSYFTTDWSMTNDDDWHSGRWITGGPRGEAAVRTTALAFKIRVKVTEYLSSQIQSIDVNVKFPDNRFKRGLAAQTVGEQRQQTDQ